MVALALADLTQQYILEDVKNVSAITSTAITLSLISVFALPMALFGSHSGDFKLLFEQSIIIKVLINSFIAAIATFAYFKSLSAKNISLSLIFISMSVVFSTIFGIIIFKESTSFTKFLGITLVIFAVVVVKFKNIHLEKNNLIGFIAGALFSVVYIIDKAIVLNIDPMVYIAATFFLSGAWMIVFNSKLVLKEVRIISFKTLKPIMLSAAAYLAYNLFTYTAYKVGGEVGKIDAMVVNSEIFLVIIFEYFALKHTEGVWRKFITAGIAFVGVLLLGFYS